MTHSLVRLSMSFVVLVLSLAVPAGTASGQGDNATLRETPLVAQGTSRALRSYQTRNRATPVINKTVRTHRPTSRIASQQPTAQLPDTIRQESATPTSEQLTPAGTGFEGLSDDDNAEFAGVRLVPPDPQGDVGPAHYIQMINVVYAVYDKTTGEIVPDGGPFPNNALWEGFGGPCELQNDGDPIVLYDHLADRWLFSQFAIPGYQCFAVSATNDPLGEYYLYQFLVSPGIFGGLLPDINDYPKIGVWPDAYYMTFNEFTYPWFGGAATYNGVVVAAFERELMLSGGQARGIREGPLQCDSECYFSVQPSHLEGPPPPPGTPNTFVMAWDDQAWGTGTGADGYRLWDFAVDWNDYLSSTFTPQPQANTTAFDAVLCGGARDCIPQPAPGEPLDSLSVFTMYRAQYRNFGTHQTLVLNHTVNAGSQVAGVRWVELRKTGGEADWSTFQTGTYAPNDGVHRWMGSIAMDGAGNIGLGYSASSENLMPSIWYTSRSATDTPGIMAGGEQTMITGTSYQTASSNRWGDYSTMSIDPADDCTFWYTQEYQADDGDGQTDFDFKTWVGSFKLPNCGGSPGAPPIVMIENPPNDSSYTQHNPVTFKGSAVDVEDGDISAAIMWTSDIDGPLGTGASVTRSDLLVGTHLITASVEDSTFLSDEDQITITITASPPGSTMHVASVVTGTRNLGGGLKQGTATVTIHDQNGVPVPNTQVTGDFSGTFSEPGAFAITDTNGVAVLETAGAARGGVEVVFCVTGLTHATLTYDFAGNVVTCSTDVPGGDPGGGDPTYIRVQSVVTGTLNVGQGNKRGTATVTVVNDLGGAVSGAQVTGMFEGTFTDAAIGFTAGNGTVTFVTSSDPVKGGVTVTFCVSDVVGSLPYDASSSAGVCAGP